MSSSAHAITRQALDLDAGERLQLAAALIDSVEGPEDPEWAAAWTDALRRRTAAADEREARGQPRGTPWSEVRARLVSELAKG